MFVLFVSSFVGLSFCRYLINSFFLILQPTFFLLKIPVSMVLLFKFKYFFSHKPSFRQDYEDHNNGFNINYFQPQKTPRQHQSWYLYQKQVRPGRDIYLQSRVSWSLYQMVISAHVSNMLFNLFKAFVQIEQSQLCIFSSSERRISLHTCATNSELQSDISTMATMIFGSYIP